MDPSASARDEQLPFSVFDRMFERTAFVTGWLVEGIIDDSALSLALEKVTTKWRMLAGRIRSSNDSETGWSIAIPPEPLPAEYRKFVVTTSTSDTPLSQYIHLPISTVSPSLPPSLFIHPSTPRNYAKWESENYPLTCWHLTYFPPMLSEDGKGYTCLGFARCHGAFDGVGAAMIVRALSSEMKGDDWEIPYIMPKDLTENPISRAVKLLPSNADSVDHYRGFSVLGIFGSLRLIAWHLLEKWWRGANRQIVLVPKSAITALVGDVRSKISEDSLTVTTGDIIVAWVFKTIYSKGSSPSTIVHCSNLASFRTVLADEGSSLAKYPHNAFIPLPYPTITVSELQEIPLHELASEFSRKRKSLSTSHVLSAYQTLQRSITTFPLHPNAHESLLVSNVSASRILETDWSTIGGSKTLCGYRYQLTPTELLWTNAIYIAGRLDDGSVVLDMSLNKARLELLTAEVLKYASDVAY
ncbi:hypothetical protein BDQ17DRAFT_1240912 [Cyathus striatus]|nr:hypothetical protein BDQ17DRAFT_1240912 [Cyathus striatus]